MQFIIAAIIFIIGTGGLGFLSYYNYIIQKNTPIAILTLSFAVLCLILAMISIHLFLTRKLKKSNEAINLQLEQWRTIGYNTQKAGDIALMLPFAMIIYDENYRISWANNYAYTLFGENIIKDELKLSEISQELYEIAINQNKDDFLLKYKDSYFDVGHKKQINTLYFFDVTEREKLNIKYGNRITGIGIIELDNLDESLKKFDVQEKSNIRGQLLGIITDWLEKHHCYLQNNQDRMLFIVDQESLNNMINEKFSVLNEVHRIAQANRLKLTLSMGIACYDVDYEELGRIAQNAIELAEKRGGDQIVVNVEHKKIQFFGGNINSQEKNTLIEARVQAASLKEAVDDSTDILIMCHNFADCDALGSMIGVFHMVETSGKPVKMVFEAEKADVTVKKIYTTLKGYPNILKNFVDSKTALETIKPTTLLIITDTQSPSLVMFKELYEKAKRVSIIDHHRAGDPGYSGYLTYYVETSASSAVELVSEMFMFYNSNIQVSSMEASIMLAGVIVDTNNFTMRSGSRTFEAAATLKTMGADIIYVRKLLQEPLDSEKVIADAITNATVIFDKFGIICLREDQKISDRTTLAKISDKLLTIEGVEASFTIGYLDADLVGISARSLGDSINVQVIMELMGGGGHFNSAACQIKGKSIPSIKEELIEQIREEYVDKNDATLPILLLEDVKGKGKKDEVITVSLNLANKLINEKKAEEASEEALKKLNDKKKKEKQNENAHRDILTKFRDDINGKSITMELNRDSQGKVIHITKTKICEEFNKQTGITLNRNKIELPGDIMARGIYTINVRLSNDIVASFSIKIEDEK